LTICLFDYFTGTLTSEPLFSSEPLRFSIEQEKIGPFLSAFGMKVIEHIDSNEMEHRYLNQQL
jgi:hypothetical protein